MSRANTKLAALRDLEPTTAEFAAAVEQGLSSTPKRLPCEFFYDRAGSLLFDQICVLPEYYPTRTEIGILERHSVEIGALVGPESRVVEFGSGAGIKIRLLLRGLSRPACYIPVDISRPHLTQASASLAEDFPDLPILPVCADYNRPFGLPGSGRRTVGFFPGSTIGNFTPAQAQAFLSRIRRVLGPDGVMIIGVDLRKDRSSLIAAYDDAAGVTAAFNLNLLARINRELGGDFQLDRFRHVARWDEVAGRIEMHLESLDAQQISVGTRTFSFAAGETIHTENSYKYSVAEFQSLARAAGFSALAVWTDAQSLFSVHALGVSPGEGQD